MNIQPIEKNAVQCRICGAGAHRFPYHFECSDNSNHVADLRTGLFCDKTLPSDSQDDDL